MGYNWAAYTLLLVLSVAQTAHARDTPCVCFVAFVSVPLLLSFEIVVHPIGWWAIRMYTFCNAFFITSGRILSVLEKVIDRWYTKL